MRAASRELRDSDGVASPVAGHLEAKGRSRRKRLGERCGWRLEDYLYLMLYLLDVGTKTDILFRSFLFKQLFSLRSLIWFHVKQR